VTDLAKAVLASLDDQALDELARRLAPRLAAHSVAPTWLDVDSAAARLQCGRRRIYDLVSQGRLVPRRDGRRLLFRTDDLTRYLEEDFAA
jgi:excisionase family DNA binding protein